MVSIAVDPQTKRLQCLLRHIADVREDTEILGGRLIERGEFDFGKELIQHGLVHDNSKFEGIEWQQLNGHHDHLLHEAIRVHAIKNPHHPEYWANQHQIDMREAIHAMPRIYVAEMVCDWHARSTELGTNIREWVTLHAPQKFSFSTDDQVGTQIKEFLDLLLEHWD